MIVKTIPHSEYPYEIWLVFFSYQGASANIAILQDHRDTAYLYDVVSTNRRNGEASALIREIDEYCLANQIMLIVEADVYESGRDGIQNNDELKSWYEKNGAYFVEYSEHGKPMLLLGNHINM